MCGNGFTCLALLGLAFSRFCGSHAFPRSYFGESIVSGRAPVNRAAISGRRCEVTQGAAGGVGLADLYDLRGEAATLPKRMLFAHRGWRADSDYWRNREYALMRGDEKYLVMEAGNDRLYDVSADPYEVDNRRYAEAERATRLRAEAHSALARFLAEGKTVSVEW